MGDLAHRSPYLFEARCRAELDDRDPLGQADIFVRGSLTGHYASVLAIVACAPTEPWGQS